MLNQRIFFTVAALLAFSVFGLCQAVVLPDLDLANCACKDGKLIYTVINHGPGGLNPGWNGFTDVFFNGVKMGSIPLHNPTSTAGGGIEKPGGTSTYLVALTLTSPVTVDFYVDSINQIVEANESNNKRTGYNPRPCAALPDLIIESIGTSRDGCFVAVQVTNLGPGSVPVEAWTVHTPDSPGVFLFIDGKPWGGASIWRFDPARALLPPGGTAEYLSSLSLKDRIAEVKAIIDKTGKIAETHEGNNTLFARRGCRP